ncbi:hypothetical protein M2T38_27040, partial [Klebsiella pneumoniae]|nr:hypothetical protein [Klebsiella pneumoniae]
IIIIPICWKIQIKGLWIFILNSDLKANGRLTRRFSRSMGGHLANIEKYGGIIEYYESCREYIGKYYLRFERIWSGYAI